MDSIIYILVILILLSGFFSGAEIALFSLSQAKVRSLLEQDRKNAKLLERIKNEPQKLLITILICNNLVNIGASSLATVVAIERFGSIGAGIATGIMTFLILFFGEIIPKSIAQRSSTKLSLYIAPVMRAVMFVLTPLVWAINGLTSGFQKLVRMPETTTGISEEEVRAMVNLGHEAGKFEADEKEMIERVFLLNDITAEDVMTPEEYFVFFETNDTMGAVLPVIEESGYSRFPVLHPNSKEVEGVVYLKDIFTLFASDEMGKVCSNYEGILSTKVSAIIKKPEFIPETMPVDDLLKDFQKKHIHIAIVVDEHGTTRGLVTLEDLLEEIVGEIIDETDVDDTMIQRIDKNSVLVDSRVSIGQVNTFFNSRLEGARQKSVGWLVLKKFGRIPDKGDAVTIGNYKFIIEEADERKIKRLLIVKKAKARAQG
ncbi:hemolysin family protein [Patescibacteria group bacterium]